MPGMCTKALKVMHLAIYGLGFSKVLQNGFDLTCLLAGMFKSTGYGWTPMLQVIGLVILVIKMGCAIVNPAVTLVGNVFNLDITL